MIALLIISTGEFVGLGELERRALNAIEVLYRPPMLLFMRITPSAWPSTGNVLLGFVWLFFSGILYAVMAGLFAVGWNYLRGRRRPDPDLTVG